jgi:hypothetical protein
MARTLPDWPAMMRRDLARLYVDMTAAEWECAVNDGTLPAPHIVNGKERWRRAEIDAHLDRLAGDEPDWQRQCKLFEGRAA